MVLSGVLLPNLILYKYEGYVIHCIVFMSQDEESCVFVQTFYKNKNKKCLAKTLQKQTRLVFLSVFQSVE